MEKKTMAYCGRCHKETCHKRGRRGRWHCLVCGIDNVSLRPGGKVEAGLPPGFLVEKQPNGELRLYVAGKFQRKEVARRKSCIT